jgi:hypothetical protein
MDVFLDLVSRFGPMLAALVVVVIYHAKIVKTKDAEIRRVNEARIEDAKANNQRLLTMVMEQVAASQETTAALNLVVERLR